MPSANFSECILQNKVTGIASMGQNEMLGSIASEYYLSFYIEDKRN